MSHSPQKISMVTIDVEPDNVWTNTQSKSFSNIESLKRFHALCSRYYVRPTYLLTYSVASDNKSSKILESLLSEGNCEIGIHPHYWETPPIESDDLGREAWVGSHYSDEIIEEKLVNLIELISSRFDAPISHRSGRWGMETRQVNLLSKNGIKIDSSVTPGIDWSITGAYDYSEFPSIPYYLSSSDMSSTGDSPVLEIPCSIKPGMSFYGLQNVKYIRGALRRLRLDNRWLRPSPEKTKEDLVSISNFCSDQFSFLNLMTHSSEFMKGCNPFWNDDHSIELLYSQLETTFAHWNNMSVKSLTLKEYKQYFDNSSS